MTDGARRGHRVPLRAHPVGAARSARARRPRAVVAAVADDGSRRTLRVLAWASGGAGLAMLGGAALVIVVREGAVARFNDDARCLLDKGMTRAQNCGADEATANSAEALGWAGFALGAAPDGSSCSVASPCPAGLLCCGGACRACCASEHCTHGNARTCCSGACERQCG